MSGEEFIELVRQMRNAQRAYFKYMNVKDLIEAKRLEAQVDRALAPLQADVRADRTTDLRQGDLFKPVEDPDDYNVLKRRVKP